MIDLLYDFFQSKVGVVLLGIVSVLGFIIVRPTKIGKRSKFKKTDAISKELTLNAKRLLNELSHFIRIPNEKGFQFTNLDRSMLQSYKDDLLEEKGSEFLSLLTFAYSNVSATISKANARLQDEAYTSQTKEEVARSAIELAAMWIIMDQLNGVMPHNYKKPIRSWLIRDRLKMIGIGNWESDSLGFHIRDEVINLLRVLGMQLTPAPLSNVNFEYYAEIYRRHQDAQDVT